MEVLPLAEPPKEEVSISSAAGQDSPDSEPAKESTEDAKEESKVSANLSCHTSGFYANLGLNPRLTSLSNLNHRPHKCYL